MSTVLVDNRGAAVPAVGGSVVGRRVPPVMRMVWALPVLGSGLSRRFSSFAPGESSLFGMDFSFVLAPGAVIASAALQAFVNLTVPVPAPEWLITELSFDGKVVWARLSGGKNGVDYQLQFTVTDTDSNTWVRTALVLCGLTS